MQFEDDLIIEREPMTADPVRRLVELDKEEEELRARLSQISEERAKLEGTIVEDWIDRGIQSMTIDGRVVYLVEQFFASKKADRDGVTKDRVLAALRECGLGDLVREDYAPGTLKARVKELATEEVDGEEVVNLDLIPDPLRSVLNVGTTIKPIVRRK